MTADRQIVEPERRLDARGLQCPMPLLKTKLELSRMQPGQVLEVMASDAGSARDIPAFLERSRHRLMRLERDGDIHLFLIRCG